MRTVVLAAGVRWMPILAWCVLAWCRVQCAEPTGPESGPVAVPTRQAHAVFRVTPRLFSGAQPEGDAAFAELATLGIRTVVSVDGTQPDVAAARRHGLRYVHLPIGYDGISIERGSQLVKAISEMPAPLFVHCHHGQHRGPAAVAVMAVAHEGWSTDTALAWLGRAGTSTNYAGLYRAVREFRCPDAATIAQIGKLPETTPASPLVEAMLDLDARWGRIQSWRRRSWEPGSGPSDPRLEHEALLFWEALKELGRQKVTLSDSGDYQRRHADLEAKAKDFHGEASKSGARSKGRLEDLAQGISRSCTACHRRHRD